MIAHVDVSSQPIFKIRKKTPQKATNNRRADDKINGEARCASTGSGQHISEHTYMTYLHVHKVLKNVLEYVHVLECISCTVVELLE